MKQKVLNPNENKLIHQLLSIFYRQGFREAIWPTIDETDDEPCQHQKKIDEGVFDIDNLLGLYDPKDQTIKLFTKCIEAVAKKLALSVQDLQDIVLLHEFGHWITHKLPDNNNDCWEGYPGNAVERVHEGWAQLITWWVAKEHEKLNNVFLELNKKQTEPYQIWKGFQNSPVDSSLISLILTRKYSNCKPPFTGGYIVTDWKEFDEIQKDAQGQTIEQIEYVRRGWILGRQLNIA